MFRVKLHCSGILVVPRKLADVISVTPAILPNCRSNGVATDEAMISGAAPGRVAATDNVGKSTCGSADTGSTRNENTPARAIAMASSVVATGRCMNGAKMFIVSPPERIQHSCYRRPDTPQIFSPDYRRKYK